MCRCLLTDLGSTNGTFVNRAQLRPHRDTQIKANDVISLGGGSGIAFCLIAVEPRSFPGAVDRARRSLRDSHADMYFASDGADDSTEADDGDLEHQHLTLISQALSSQPDGAMWLEVQALDQPLAFLHCLSSLAL